MVVARDSLMTSVLPAGGDAFRTHFNQEPFQFGHRLCEAPAFTWDRIRALARRSPFKNSYSGALPVADGFRQPAGTKLSFDEAFDRLKSAPGWIILKKLNREPEYAAVQRDCLAEIERRMDRSFEPLIESRTMSLIISSPGQVTPYHVDADCNFLFQLQGPKTLYVFDGRDRTVLPAQEEERFWAGDLNAARYREENQKKAWSFALAPGNGVHIPVMFPHWAASGTEISVGLSINFRFHGYIRGDVERMNHLLRRFGLRPHEAGHSPLADFVKIALYSPPRKGIELAKRVWDRLS